MSEVFEKSKTEGNARLVLLALADACNDDACCWPSIRKLSEKANLSEPITKKYLSAFISIGLVEREDRMDKNGRQTSNLYTIKKEKIGEDFLSKETINSCAPKSRINQREGLTPVSGGGANPSYPVEGLTPVRGSYMNRHKEPLIKPSCGYGSEVPEEFASMVTPEPELFAKPNVETKSKPVFKNRKRLDQRPPDDEFIAKMKQIHGNIDVDRQLQKMDSWLAANPTRQKTRRFISGWLSRCTEFKKGYNADGTINWDEVKPNE